MENKIFKILSDMSDELNYQQLEKLQQVLLTRLSDETEIEEKVLDNNDYLELFVSAKRVEGCTERTIEYYRVTIEKMLDERISTATASFLGTGGFDFGLFNCFAIASA